MCPFDVLFRSLIRVHRAAHPDLLHDKEKLGEWMQTVPQAPELEVGAQEEMNATVLLAADDINVRRTSAFGVIAAMMIFAALCVVTTKNVVHAALWLVFVFAGVAAQYILAAAEFVAVSQVLVYIGAVMVLFLFGIMLTRAKLGSDEEVEQPGLSSASPSRSCCSACSLRQHRCLRGLRRCPIAGPHHRVDQR